MSKKKILHIVEAFGSGIFSFLVDLVNETCDSYEIVIAHGKREETPNNFMSYFKSNIKFIEVENFQRNIGSADIKAFFELRKIIKQEKPDIIHLHSSKAGFLGRFAANTHSTKILYNPHGFSFLMTNQNPIKRFFYWLFEKIASFKKCTIIGCSNGEYQEALKLSRRSICINNGINIEKINKTILHNNKLRKKINFNNLNICTIGRIGYQKNPFLFNKIATEFPQHNFTWIGDGELKNELTSNNITVTGWKSHNEVLKLLNETDIFVLFSLWEGLPISLLEAMYLKKLCIVTNCIGNKDVIEDNTNGYIVDNMNVKNIFDNLNTKDYYRLSNAAYNDILNLYTINKMNDEYRKIYDI